VSEFCILDSSIHCPDLLFFSGFSIPVFVLIDCGFLAFSIPVFFSPGLVFDWFFSRAFLNFSNLSPRLVFFCVINSSNLFPGLVLFSQHSQFQWSFSPGFKKKNTFLISLIIIYFSCTLEFH
jgi:hypothetical protein